MKPGHPNNPPITASRGRLAAGWVLSGLIALLLLSGAVNAYLASSQVLEGTSRLGYPPGLLPVIGTLELVCVVLYLVPQTILLGAILLTGYFGGAIASHLRIGEAIWFVPFLLGGVVWAGVWLREPRLGAIWVAATSRRNPGRSPRSE